MNCDEKERSIYVCSCAEVGTINVSAARMFKATLFKYCDQKTMIIK